MDDPKLNRAFALMTEALQFLDEAEASPVIGAHLDVAINSLQDWLCGFNRDGVSAGGDSNPRLT